MDVHPYRAAWQTRDLDAWGRALAPDVVIHSPIVITPFRGREAAVEVFGVLFDEMGALEITDELSNDDSHVFFWRVGIGAHTVEGVDLLRSNERGEISEIRVMIRPLPDIALFAAAIGPALAAKRAPIRGPIARALIFPLRPLLLFADRISSRLVQRPLS